MFISSGRPLETKTERTQRNAEKIELIKYVRGHNFAASTAYGGRKLNHEASIGSRGSRELPVIANGNGRGAIARFSAVQIL
jgi:hypothetical protein